MAKSRLRKNRNRRVQYAPVTRIKHTSFGPVVVPTGKMKKIVHLSTDAITSRKAELARIMADANKDDGPETTTGAGMAQPTGANVPGTADDTAGQIPVDSQG